jgi:hypothetical protein
MAEVQVADQHEYELISTSLLICTITAQALFLEARH